MYSKLSLVDLAGSEGLTVENDGGEHVTDRLHVMNSISAYVKLFLSIFVHCSICSRMITLYVSHLFFRLGDVLSSLTSEKDSIPYENSILTRILADSLGELASFLFVSP